MNTRHDDDPSLHDNSTPPPGCNTVLIIFSLLIHLTHIPSSRAHTSFNDVNRERMYFTKKRHHLYPTLIRPHTHPRVATMSTNAAGQKQPSGPAAWKGFASGSLGAMMSGAVTHPIDLVKVRMQLHGGANAPGMFATGAHVLRAEGVFALYKGLSASLMRQASFIGTKFGAYDVLKRALREPADDAKLPFWKMTLCGVGAGAIGAAVGNPADLAMVRMQADGRLPVELRRNYRNGMDALVRVTREEGPAALWRGCAPTVNRAMIVTASQMAVYDQAKHYILDHTSMEDGLMTQTGASFAAGVVAALTSNPIDLAKSRLMSMKADEHGKMPYTGTFDCIAKTVRREGISAVYKGLVPTTARQVPLNMVRFVSVEYFRRVLEPL